MILNNLQYSFSKIICLLMQESETQLQGCVYGWLRKSNCYWMKVSMMVRCVQNILNCLSAYSVRKYKYYGRQECLSILKILNWGWAMGFPCGSTGKESACNVGGLGSIPGLGRSPGEGKGYPLQYSGLENSMDCTVYGVAKSLSRPSNFHFTSLYENGRLMEDQD